MRYRVIEDITTYKHKKKLAIVQPDAEEKKSKLLLSRLSDNNYGAFAALQFAQKIGFQIPEIFFPVYFKNLRNAHAFPLRDHLVHFDDVHREPARRLSDTRKSLHIFDKKNKRIKV